MPYPFFCRYFVTVSVICCFLFSGCAKEKEKIHAPTAVDFKEESIKERIIPASYMVGPSDELEVLYYMDPEYSMGDYIIDAEDKLRVDFYYYPELSKSVQVRPDGFITLPRVGDIKAAGEVPSVLAKKISETFSEYLSQPVVTVELTEFNAKINKLKAAVSSVNRGQAKYAVVRPDGKISLPYLKEPIFAAGSTTIELGKKIENAYRSYIKNISITISLLKANSYRACVIGEVVKSDCYSLSGNTSFLDILARAGGVTTKANTQQIVIISRGDKGRPVSSVIDLQNIIKKQEYYPMVQQYDVIYVPRTWLSETALTAHEIWKIIPLSVSASYNLANIFNKE